MKTFVLAIATATAMTGSAAFANANITEAEIAEIEFYAPYADASTLTEEQVLQVQNLIHSSDSESEKSAKIRAMFDTNDSTGGVVVVEPENDTAALEDEILEFVPDANVDSLTEAEMLQIENIIHSGDSYSEKRGKIQSYFS